MRSRVDTIRGLYGIADGGFRPELPMIEKVRVFVEGGAPVVQLRMKHSPARVLLAEARRALVLAGSRALIVINDRPDVALAAGAHGVHLGEDDLPVAEVRRLAGNRLIIGATVRTLAQARAAAEDGADYVGLGPVFSTSTKEVDAGLCGLDGLAEVVRGCQIPVVAIAGITAGRAADVARAGAVAAATVSGVLGALDMDAMARLFHANFLQGMERTDR